MAITCPVIPSDLPLSSVRLPGGVLITAAPATGPVPSPLQSAQALVGQLSPALAPLSTIFKIVAAIKAVLDTVTAIKDSIVPPRPGKIVSALRELGSKVSDLAELVPQLAVPLLVKDSLDLLIGYAEALDGEIGSIIAQQVQADEARTAAAAQPNGPAKDTLVSVADCVDQQVAQRTRALANSTGPVEGLIEIINLLGSLIPGIPEIPSFGDLGDDPAAARAQLNQAIAALQAIRNVIP